MARQDEPLATLAELTELLLADMTLDELFAEIAYMVPRALGSGCVCGITLERAGSPGFSVAVSDVLAEQLDQLQYDAGIGPCLDALHTGSPVLIECMAHESRYGCFPAAASAHGITNSLSVPFKIDDMTVGALNLYSRNAQAFGDLAQEIARVIARQVTVALTLALRRQSQAEVNEQLRTALTSRSVIDQAMGIVMAQSRCNAETAFGLLRAASQRTNKALRVVAQSIVTKAAHET